MRPGRRFAVLLGLAELASGAALTLGLGTPLAAGVIIAVMLNAAWFAHHDKGLWNTQGGYEYPLTLASVALALALTGRRVGCGRARRRRGRGYRLRVGGELERLGTPGRHTGVSAICR